TMVLAQKLYESGYITYMRTDSVNLSDTALNDIYSNVSKQYGEKYLQPRKYKNKNESAQEAHEAIRPTYIENTTVDDADTKRLYELIWRRTIASQMADAELEKTTAKISISTNKQELTAQGEVLKFDGFLKVYMEDKISTKTEQETTGAERSKLFPTDLGLVVTDFLKEYFSDVMDYGFTAKIEEEFDEIAEGKKQWEKIIDGFYKPFKKDVENTLE